MLFNPWPEVLKQARKEQDLSQENSAARAEVSNITWYRWESGKVYPGPKVLANLAHGVDLAPVALALRYAQALLAHYQALWDESATSDAQSDGSRPAGVHFAATADENRHLPEPVLVPGIVPGQGPVYVDIHQVLHHMATHWATAAADNRREKAGPRPASPPSRRRDR